MTYSGGLKKLALVHMTNGAQILSVEIQSYQYLLTQMLACHSIK